MGRQILRPRASLIRELVDTGPLIAVAYRMNFPIAQHKKSKPIWSRPDFVIVVFSETDRSTQNHFVVGADRFIVNISQENQVRPYGATHARNALDCLDDDLRNIQSAAIDAQPQMVT